MIRRFTLQRLGRLVLLTALSILAVFFATAQLVADDRVDVGRPVNRATSDKLMSSSAKIAELIRELGSPQFTVRRTAAKELHKIGPEAFDQLHAATEDADPEIAASARYLLRQITVRWTRPDDTATVRRLLRNYDDQGEAERKTIVQQLSVLESGEGIAGLCRVARFDRSPEISRLAALAVMRAAERSSSGDVPDPAIIGRELGESTRIASDWLRQYQAQIRDPASAVAGWQTLIDEESRRLDANLDETKPGIVLALLWNLADVHRELGDNDSLVAVADQIISTSGDSSDLMIAKFLEWLVDHESWAGIAKFEDSYNERIRQTKQSLYLLALAELRQSHTDRANSLAEEASRLAARTSPDAIEGLAEQFNLAQVIVGWGQFDWAVREYRQSFVEEPVDAPASMAGRVLLASLLQDHEHFREAAEVVEPLSGALDKNTNLKRAYGSLQRELGRYDVYLLESDAIPAREHFMLACHYEAVGDYAKQREHLLTAIEHDPKDADVLIAMYHSPEAGEAWRVDTLERIDKLSRAIEREIDDDPSNPVPYNQWAWLIANTEGDYKKAVRFSRRSLELAPGLPSFLDTLGRCYYSAGDVEKAVKYQRQAVEKIPHMQVMQRQLKLFEEKLAEQKTNSKAEDE